MMITRLLRNHTQPEPCEYLLSIDQIVQVHSAPLELEQLRGRTRHREAKPNTTTSSLQDMHDSGVDPRKLS